MSGLSVTDLSRLSGVSRSTIYKEISRGHLAAGREWSPDARREVPVIEAAEGQRWMAAYVRVTGGRPGRRWIDVKPCGTAAACRRHLRHGEKACPACLAAATRERHK
jgi:hypothetical protein